MKISKPVRAVLAAAIAALGLAACHERTHDVPPVTAAASPSAQLIGTTPAAPSGDPPGTTPVASNTTTVTKTEETTQKPQEGDNHSYSSVAPDNKQKADGQDPQQQPGRSKKD